jgi:hypothetical protein
MMELPSDPLHRPKYISKCFPFGLALAGIGIVLLLVRWLLLPSSEPLLRFGAAFLAMFSAFAGLLLVWIAVVRSWGARGVMVGSLFGAVLLFLGSAIVVVFDAVRVPKAVTTLVERVEKQTSRSQKVDPAVLEAQKPIAFDEQTLRQVDVCQYYDTWIERHLIEPYNRHASGDSKRDEAARSFILASLRNKIGNPRITPRAQLREWCAEATAGNATDPIVQFCAGLLDDDPAVETERLKQAESVLMARSDEKTALFLVRLKLWNLASRANESVPVEPVIEALSGAVLEGPLDDAEAWTWAEALEWSPQGSLLREHVDRVIVAIEPLTARQPWLAHYIQGSSELGKSFKLSGYGLKSTPADVFRKHHLAARDHFTKGWELYPQHPGCAAGMILVSTVVGEDPERERRQWFDRATMAVIDDVDNYAVYRMTLSAGWRSSRDAIRELAYVCIDSDRYDTRVPFESIRSYQSLSFNSSDSEEPYKGNEFWDLSQEIVDSYLAQEKVVEQPGYWESMGAMIAHRCGRTDDCKGYLERIGYKLDGGAARFWGIDAETWSAQMMAELGPARPFVLSSRISEESAKYDEAAASIASALKTPDLPEPARKYIEGRLANLQSMLSLQQVPWKPLFKGQSLEGWETLKGNATIDAGRIIEARNALTLVMNEPVGEVFEVRGEMEIKGEDTYVAGGFAIGQMEIARDDWVSVQLRHFKSGFHSITYRHESYPYVGFWNRVSSNTKARVHLKVIGNRCVLDLDGKKVIDRRIEEPSALNANSRFALLTTSSDDKAVVRWHSLEWRRP